MKNNMFNPKAEQLKLDDKFYNACATGNMDIIHQLCKNYPPHKNSNSIFSLFIELPQKLFPRVDLHSGGNRPLFIACKNGHKNVVDFLLSMPNFIERINKTDSLAIGLFFAIEHGHNKIADVIIPLIPRKNENYLNLAKRTFVLICKKGNLESVKYMLKNENLKINPGDLIHCTYSNFHDSLYVAEGFRLACQNGHLDLVKYLTSSPELTVHVDLDKINSVIRITDTRIIQHFIFEMNVTKQDSIIMRLNTDDDITKQIDYFIEKKRLLDTIKEELGVNVDTSTSKKKIKI